MFALKPRKEAAKKRLVLHSSSAVIINILLFFALIVTSCVPAKRTVPATQKATVSSTLSPTPGPESKRPDKDIPRPVYDRPESRTADPVDADEQAAAENPPAFDPQARSEAAQAYAASKLDYARKLVQSHKEALNLFPTATPTPQPKGSGGGFLPAPRRFGTNQTSLTPTPRPTSTPRPCDIEVSGSYTLSGTHEEELICVHGDLMITNATLIWSEVLAEGTVTVTGSTLTFSFVWSKNPGTLAISNSTVTDSEVVTEGGALNASYLTVTDSEIWTVGGALNASYLTASGWGDIFTINGGAMTVDNSSFDDYEVFTLDGGTLTATAVNVIGGDLFTADGGDLTINGGTFLDAAAFAADGGDLTITTGTFTEASVFVVEGGSMTAEGLNMAEESALFVRDGGALTATNIYVTGESDVFTDGGGGLTITDGTFEGSSVWTHDNGPFTMTDGTVSSHSWVRFGDLLTITNSNFLDTDVFAGEGTNPSTIHVVDALTIANSTFAANYTGDPDFGLAGPVPTNSDPLNHSAFLRTFTDSNGPLTILSEEALTSRNSTLWGTTIDSAAGLSLYNTILAGNSACASAVTASDHNVIDASSAGGCGLTNGSNGNVIGSDAKLRALVQPSDDSQSYFELDTGSPAIEAGDDAVCAAAPINNTSQNGLRRPQGKHCDIGSFETTVVNDRETVSPCASDRCMSSSPGTAEYPGEPINSRTGSYDYSVVDLSIPTSAGALTFTRDYASQTISQPTTLSPGWTHNLATRLILPDDPDGEEGAILFKLHSGNLFTFYENPDGTYQAGPGLQASLVRQAGPPIRFVVTDTQQNSYTFDQNGVLQSYTDASDHTWEYTYTNGKLTQVSADGGDRFLSLQYDPQGRIERVSDHAEPERFVTYHYNANGDLDYKVDVLGQTWTYEYDSILAHFLTRVAAPGNVTLEQTVYYPDGRAWKQFNGEQDPDEDDPAVELTYNADGTTTVTDALGNTQTHTYDGRGTLANNSNPEGSSTSKTYDLNFRPKTITDANGASAGAATEFGWSSDGANLLSIKDMLDHWTYISYNASNQPTIIRDPLNYRTKYFYTDTNYLNLPTRIEYPLSFDGGSTYIGTDYEYYPPSSGIFAGKVKYVTDALGHETYYEYELLSQGYIETVHLANETPSEQITIREYDDLGRLVKVTDSAGVITRNKYDLAGRLTVTINNVDPSTPNAEDPPQNLVSGENIYNLYTRYYYDARDNQIAVVDTDWNITRIYYDLANRQVGTVQNLVINDMPANSEAGVNIAINTPLTSVPAYTLDHPDWNIQTATAYDDAGNIVETRDAQGIITHNSYDQANRLHVTIQNFVGTGEYNPAYPDENVRTEYFYDLNGNMIATKDTLNVYTRTYYDLLNRPIAVVQNLNVDGTPDDNDINTPLNLVPTYSSVYPDRNLRTNTYYDANGNVIASEDPRGVITRTYYDALNRPVTVIQNLSGQEFSESEPPDAGVEANLRTDTYYDKVGNVIANIDPRGIVTRTYYDHANRPVTTVKNLTGQGIDITTPPVRGNYDQNVRTDITYDQYGRRDTTTDPLGHVTKYVYNNRGQLLKTIVNYVNGGEPQNEDNQRNIVTTYVYDALGRQIQTTDTLGRITLTVYDNLGRVTSTTQNYLQGQAQNYKDASGDRYNLITTYSYDVRGNQIAVTDTAGVITRTYYDARNRSVAVVRNLVGQSVFTPFPPERADPPSSEENLRTDTVYLGSSSVNYVVDEMGAITDYSYDHLGRQIMVLDPLGKPTSFEYDANGNRIRMTDANEVVTTYVYDNLNRLAAVIENHQPGIDPDAETNVRTEYTYDENGNRISITDGKGQFTSFWYNSLNLLSWIDRGKWLWYDFDSAGNLIYFERSGQIIISYEYDELNRLILIDYPDPDSDVTFEYDALGHRQSMSDGLGTTTWDHNNLGLPNSITDPFAASISYDYDEVGNRTSLTYPDSRVVNYQYNDVNRLTTVTSDQAPVASYQYDAVGRVKTIQRQNGVNTLYNYYGNGWLQDITHSLGSTMLASYQYGYDSVGNRTQAIEEMRQVGVPFTPTPTETLTATASQTGTATETPTGTLTPTPTETLIVTFTDTLTPTDTATPSETPTASETSTATETSIPTETETETAIPSHTPDFTSTPSETSTATETSIPTETGTATMTLTPSETSTPSETPTASETSTATETSIPTETGTATMTLTPSETSTPSETPTATVIPTATLRPVIPVGPVTIDYVYDPLYRLKEANYSTGDYYHYTYDEVGNVLQSTESIDTATVTTTFGYNDGNELITAQMDNSSIVWKYYYDDTGNLICILPNAPYHTNGAKLYTYNAAGHLIKTETHDGSGYQLQAEMLYDGLGQRLSMTSYALGASVVTNYVLDPMQNAHPLTATSEGNMTVYLYGIDPIAELTTDWSYSLPDATGTPRQLANAIGEVTLAGSYTPWGDSRGYVGTGSFTFGYFGGLMDAATGLQYVGNGQYYDPTTGRFITREAQPGRANPYVPWNNPASALLAPLALVGLIYGRKRKKSKFDYFVITLFLALGIGIELSACTRGPAPVTTPGTSMPFPAVPPTNPSTATLGPTQTPVPLSWSMCRDNVSLCRVGILPLSRHNYYTREQWGAANIIWEEIPEDAVYANPKQALNTVVVHHFGEIPGDQWIMDGVQGMMFIQNHYFSDGDTPYHFGIDMDGDVFEGRPIGIRGTHVQTANTGKIGVIFLGNFDNIHYEQGTPVPNMPSMASIDAAVELINALRSMGYTNIQFLTGHRNFLADPTAHPTNAYGAQSRCPGQYFSDELLRLIARDTILIRDIGPLLTPEWVFGENGYMGPSPTPPFTPIP